jgi:hypothetical protein
MMPAQESVYAPSPAYVTLMAQMRRIEDKLTEIQASRQVQDTTVPRPQLRLVEPSE